MAFDKQQADGALRERLIASFDKVIPSVETRVQIVNCVLAALATHETRKEGDGERTDESAPLTPFGEMQCDVRTLVNPWIKGTVSFEEWCAAVDRIFPPAALATPETSPLREALEAIVIRCEEGDKRADWIPVILSIAREALGHE